MVCYWISNIIFFLNILKNDEYFHNNFQNYVIVKKDNINDILDLNDNIQNILINHDENLNHDDDKNNNNENNNENNDDKNNNNENDDKNNDKKNEILKEFQNNLLTILDYGYNSLYTKLFESINDQYSNLLINKTKESTELIFEKILFKIEIYLKMLKNMYVHDSLIDQFINRVVYDLVQLISSQIYKNNLSTMKTAINLKIITGYFDSWLETHHFKELTKLLAPLKQIGDVIMMKKDLLLDDELVQELFPLLSKFNIYTIGIHYQPDEFDKSDVSLDTVKKLKKKLESLENDGNDDISFYLDLFPIDYPLNEDISFIKNWGNVSPPKTIEEFEFNILF
jgi:hypothetical protein